MLRIILLLIIAIHFTCQPGLVEPPKPHIILILCDDLGWGDVGFNGNDEIQTPRLDELAEASLVLNRFYSASPVCSPTRASCLTGRSPYRQGIHTANHGHLKVEEHTLPEYLKSIGYTTGHFGKWHLGTMTTKIRDSNRGKPGDSTHFSIPTMHGYDEYFATEAKVPTYDPMIRPASFDTVLGESLRYGWAKLKPGSDTLEFNTRYWAAPDSMVTAQVTGDDSKVIMDRALDFLQRAVEQNQLSFSTVWLHTPHLPVVTDSQFMSLYSDLSHREQLYYGTITAMDEQIGRLYDQLKQLQIEDQTMIWFTSDNGPERDTPGSAGRFRERKRSLYEGGLRVPSLIYWPGVANPGTSDFPVCTHDILPTLLDHLSVSLLDGRPIDGMSVMSLLDQDVPERKPIGFRHNKRMSWVTDTYKLISADDGESFELYHLVNDPQESNNIIGAHPELAEQLQEELEAWMNSCEDSEKGLDYGALVN